MATENPFSAILPVKEEYGAVFIQVSPSKNKESLYKSLTDTIEKNLIVNVDITRLRQIIDKASNEFEELCPIFEYYNEEFDNYIVIKTQPLKASVMIKREGIDFGFRPSLNLIKHRLIKSGILFGINDELIQQIVEKKILEEHLTVAEGVPPQTGANGKIEYKISLERDYTPKLLEDGSVDYRDIHSFTLVKEGDIIAVRIPPTEGVSGKSVLGDEIPATPGKPYTLNASENIIVSEDGEQLVAAKSGIITRQDNNLFLKDYLEIERDVDFEVGNVNFPGKVIINGNVKPGFEVISDSDILIHGEVEGATIKSLEGTVQVEKGIIGRGHTFIYAKNRINVNFAQNCTLETEGVINVTTSLLHCTTTCTDLITDSNSSTIIGGITEAYRSIEIGNTGNEDDTQTVLIVDDKERAELLEKKKKLAEAYEQLDRLFLPAERDLRAKNSMIKKLGGNVSPKIKQEYAKSVNRVKSIKSKIDLVNSNITSVEEALENSTNGEGYIVINGKMYPGTVIRLYRTKKEIQKADEAIRFKVEEDKLTVSHKK